MLEVIRSMINREGLNSVCNENDFIKSAVTNFLLKKGYDYTKFFINEYKKDPVRALEYVMNLLLTNWNIF